MSTSIQEASRSRLPSRRPALTQTLSSDNHEFTGSVGTDPNNNRPLEAFFCARGKSGADLDALLYDCGVLLSLAVQHGTPIEALKTKMADPASPIRLALEMMDQLDQEIR